MTEPYVNIHTHTANGEGIELVNIDKFDGPLDAVFASAGLHPWNIGKCNHLQTLATIKNWCDSGLLAAIGEIGIDRNIDTDLNLQKELLHVQLNMARQFQTPVLIHCVRAYSDFLQILRQYPHLPMIFHGFNGKKTMAEQLLAHGAMLSFGTSLLTRNNLQDVFKTIPNDCIFLETDTKDVNISTIYAFAAELKHISLEELKHIIFCNLTRVFGNRFETAKV